MEGLFFNVNGGYGYLTLKLPCFPSPTQKANLSSLRHCSYLEGIVRGYRNSLLTGQHYANLTQCDSIDGMLTLYNKHMVPEWSL